MSTQSVSSVFVVCLLPWFPAYEHMWPHIDSGTLESSLFVNVLFQFCVHVHCPVHMTEALDPARRYLI